MSVTKTQIYEYRSTSESTTSVFPDFRARAGGGAGGGGGGGAGPLFEKKNRKEKKYTLSNKRNL